MRGLPRPLIAAFALGTLFAASCSSCESCGATEEEPATPAEPDVAAPEEPDTGPDLEEAEKKAEEAADMLAFETSQKARFIAAELEGQTKEVEGPQVKRGATPKDTGALSDAQKRKAVGVFNQNQSALQKCYERALKRDPEMRGKVVLAVRIGSSGEPRSVSARSSAINDKAALDCMEREARGWLFPRPSGGSVTLRKPYVFEPQR